MSKYNGWLVSDSFMKRSAAVFGHYMVFSFILSLICFIFFGLLGLLGFSIVKDNPKLQDFIKTEINNAIPMDVYISTDSSN